MKRLSFLLLLSISLPFTSCKKWQHQYPEDTERTKDTPTERLTNKWWTLQSASINGIDFTDSVQRMFGKYQIYFSQTLEQSTSSGIDFYQGVVKTDLLPSFPAVWHFKNDNDDIGIAPLFGSSTPEESILPCYLNHNSFNVWLYNIQKLTSSEFKISITTINNDTTIINCFVAQ